MTKASPAPKRTGVLPGERCGNPVLDAEKRGTMCLKPAVAEREVPTGFGDEKIALTFCAKHAAAIDANGGEMKCDREAADKADDAKAAATRAAKQAKLPPHKRRTVAQENADDDDRLARAVHRARGTRGEL
jgi:hypothetical protein